MNVNVTIPANTTATVILPEAKLAETKEGETHVNQVKGIESSKQTADGVKLEIGSGSYKFSYLLKQTVEDGK